MFLVGNGISGGSDLAVAHTLFHGDGLDGDRSACFNCYGLAVNSRCCSGDCTIGGVIDGSVSGLAADFHILCKVVLAFSRTESRGFHLLHQGEVQYSYRVAAIGRGANQYLIVA